MKKLLFSGIVVIMFLVQGIIADNFFNKENVNLLSEVSFGYGCTHSYIYAKEDNKDGKTHTTTTTCTKCGYKTVKVWNHDSSMEICSCGYNTICQVCKGATYVAGSQWQSFMKSYYVQPTKTTHYFYIRCSECGRDVAKGALWSQAHDFKGGSLCYCGYERSEDITDLESMATSSQVLANCKDDHSKVQISYKQYDKTLHKKIMVGIYCGCIMIQTEGHSYYQSICTGCKYPNAQVKETQMKLSTTTYVDEENMGVGSTMSVLQEKQSVGVRPQYIPYGSLVILKPNGTDDIQLGTYIFLAVDTGGTTNTSDYAGMDALDMNVGYHIDIYSSTYDEENNPNPYNLGITQEQANRLNTMVNDDGTVGYKGKTDYKAGDYPGYVTQYTATVITPETDHKHSLELIKKVGTKTVLVRCITCTNTIGTDIIVNSYTEQ